MRQGDPSVRQAAQLRVTSPARLRGEHLRPGSPSLVSTGRNRRHVHRYLSLLLDDRPTLGFAGAWRVLGESAGPPRGFGEYVFAPNMDASNEPGCQGVDRSTGPARCRSPLRLDFSSSSYAE